MKYTKEIFDILSRGGFISNNSVSSQTRHIYDAIEEQQAQYAEYFRGVGFDLQGGSGYWYFSRTETKVELQDKLTRFCRWIDRLDFLKTFNSSFGSGFQFRVATILEQMASDVELKDKAGRLYQERMTLEEVVEKVTDELAKAGFAELENAVDGTWKVTAAFNYMEELVDCLTLLDDVSETDTPETATQQ